MTATAALQRALLSTLSSCDASDAATTELVATICARLAHSSDQNAARPDPAAASQTTLPVTQHLQNAVDVASENQQVADLVGAIHAVFDKLVWYNRPTPTDASFRSQHGLAMVFGEGGIGLVPDLRVGLVLTSPKLSYPEHHHPPQELYLVLSDGEWQNADLPWHRPGIGGLVHNPPAITHAMRALDKPLFAVWFQLV